MKRQTKAERLAWLRRRQNGIGGSDAPSIMGASPWESAFELWARKTGRLKPQPQNEAMRRGLDMEPVARRAYEAIVGAKFPAAEIEHGRIPFMRANLDGLNRELAKVLEIKCPGEKDHAVALRGEIPEHYLWQLIHLMAVSDLPACDYFSFDGWYGAPPITLPRDLKAEKKLIEAESAFWLCVTHDVPPPVDIPILKRRQK